MITSTIPQPQVARKPTGSPHGEIQSKEETMSDLGHGVRFPGECEGYRKARNELLSLENDLRRNIEVVAAKRRGLPLGGMPKQDYVFDEMDGDSAGRFVSRNSLWKAKTH
jgi:predicted dithiol-disulfide oxidoreductase (DUF899 family)